MSQRPGEIPSTVMAAPEDRERTDLGPTCPQCGAPTTFNRFRSRGCWLLQVLCTRCPRTGLPDVDDRRAITKFLSVAPNGDVR
jgi:hypothetical protein